MSRPDLRRSLSLTDATMINVGTMLGSGIFITPAAIARDLEGSLWHLAVWIGGGLFCLLGTIVIAELGTMMPATGGIYVYLERAYGPLWGFLYGWALFLAIQCGSIAAVAVATATYVGYFVPLDLVGQRAVAIAAIAALTWINMRGVAQGALVQNLLTTIKVLAVAVLAALAFAAGHTGNLAPLGASDQVSMAGLLAPLGLSMVAALWCYDGWIHVSYIAGELRDPGRVLPRAAISSALIVMAIYLALNLAYLVVLGVPGMASSDLVASEAALRAIGPAGGAFVAALVAVSTLGANNGFILAGARVYYAMAKDGRFFGPLARVNPVRAVPAVSLLAQAVWSSLLVFSGRYDQIFTYVIFVEFLFFGLAAGAVMILRKREPDAARPYRAWGYPVTPIAFMVLAAALLASTLVSSTREAGIGLLVMLSGVPAYYFWERRRKRPPQATLT